MQSATCSAAGKLIDGDPSIVDPSLVCYIENNERRIETLTSAEFCEMFAK